MLGIQFTKNERAFMVTVYAETHNSTETCRRFALMFPNWGIPSKGTFLSNFHKYQTHGTSENRNTGKSGQPRTVQTPQNIAAVRQEIAQNGQVSVRRNNLPHISKASFNRITKYDLKYHPYRIQRCHALLQRDLQPHIDHYNWLLGRPARFLLNIIIGNEAVFQMNGWVNTWNVRAYAIQAQDVQNFVFDHLHSRDKLTVWIGLCGDNTIFGPIFFDNNANWLVYHDMINTDIVPELHQSYGTLRNRAIPRKWWVQDGATAHRRILVCDCLQQLFPNSVCGLSYNQVYTLRSPDLTPLDFYLWGYLKKKVFQTHPANLQDLRNWIVGEVQALRRTWQVRAAFQDMRERARRVVVLGGA